MATNLTDLYVNKVGKGENVLKDGNGECEDNLITCSGTIVNGGPQVGGQYNVGSQQKIYYDTKCISSSNGYCSFQLKQGDSC